MPEVASTTLDASFCVRAVERAFAQYGVPEIFNTDQGCQFTAKEFTQPLLARGVKLSMDGKGRCLDNVFVERLWRTVKYDEIYLRSYQSMLDAEKHLTAFFRSRPDCHADQVTFGTAGATIQRVLSTGWEAAVGGRPWCSSLGDA